MKKIRCSLAFHQSRLDELPIFAGGVMDGIYGNPTVYVTPPILQTDFLALIENYSATRATYKQGGLAQKGPFLAAKTALMNGLDTLADYVNPIADGDANLVTIAGFVPTKGSATEVPVPVQPTGVKVTRGTTGVLLAECDNQTSAVAYVCIMTVGEPLPPEIMINTAGQMYIEGDTPAPPAAAEGAVLPEMAALTSGGVFDFNISRKKQFIGLTPGVICYFVFFATNASGVGPLSNPESLMVA